MEKDTTLSEFVTLAKTVKVGDDLWDVYVDLLLRKQTLYVRRCVGASEFQAIEDAYNYVIKVFDGGESSRAFVKNKPDPVSDN